MTSPIVTKREPEVVYILSPACRSDEHLDCMGYANPQDPKSERRVCECQCGHPWKKKEKK